MFKQETKEAFALLSRNQQVYDFALVATGLRSFFKRTHAANANWWLDLETGKPKQRNPHELICLMHSEVSEAMEADRKNLNDDKLTDLPGVQVELADLFIRLGDFVGGIGLSLPVANALSVSYGLFMFAFEDMKNAKGNTGEMLCNLHSRLTNLSMRFRLHENKHLSLASVFSGSIAFCAVKGFDVFPVIERKMEVNAKRVDHTIEHRKNAKDGKRY